MLRSMFIRQIIFGSCLLLPLRLLAEVPDAAEFDTFMKPLLTEHCAKCHGDKKVKGDVNLVEVTTVEQLLAKPDLIHGMIEVIEARDMPPEDEPQPEEPDRAKLLASLKTMLRKSVSSGEVTGARLRRLNRFQYNNAIRDLFQMNRDLFALPEKLMTRHGNHLFPANGKMPDQVAVTCQSLRETGGLAGVLSFPKDLRAAHGFDNQANQLTLSPLLLDTFLKLSLSILNSPDFNRQTVGVWSQFFGEPAAGTDLEKEVRTRLGHFLPQAFRAAIDPETLDRYTAYTLSRIQQGLSFTDSMKKAASAVLSSPRFLYRPGKSGAGKDLFVIASDLSFFLWGSIPDQQLLQLAGSGELARPGVFDETVTRMLSDPKIERFLDAFPAQWMQLENVLAATPDPKLARLFRLDQDNPASLQMVLEPLLLFDAVFVEDRPVTELITPAFAYQSEFLKDWYTSDLRPPQVDPEPIAAANLAKDELRESLQETIQTTRAELETLVATVRAGILAHDRARSADEVTASGSGTNHVSEEDLLQAMSPDVRNSRDALRRTLEESEAALKKVPKNQLPKNAQEDAERRFDDEMRKKMRSQTFARVAASDPRYGGVITNAAMLSMTSGPTRTHPIARGAWVIGVIFNDPPAPPPNNIPPLNEEDISAKNLTIREQFALHRENPDCAGCHARLDPLGFALENFDITGRWRDKYDNGRQVDPSGTLMKQYDFDGIVRFKQAILQEDRRFAKAFTAHLLRFALSRELGPADALTVDTIVEKAGKEGYRLRSLIREITRSGNFIHAN